MAVELQTPSPFFFPGHTSSVLICKIVVHCLLCLVGCESVKSCEFIGAKPGLTVVASSCTSLDGTTLLCSEWIVMCQLHVFISLGVRSNCLLLCHWQVKLM